jgi:hypothetical protein
MLLLEIGKDTTKKAGSPFGNPAVRYAGEKRLMIPKPA